MREWLKRESEYIGYEIFIEFLETSHEIEGAQNLNVTLSFYHPKIDELHLYFFISSKLWQVIKKIIRIHL